MKQETFEKTRRKVWTSLDRSLQKPSKGHVVYQEQYSDQFLQNYRETAKDLSLAQSRAYSRELIEQLNDLVSRAHNVVHVRRSNWMADVLEYFRCGFPQEVRRAKMFVLVAAIAFLLPALAVSVMVASEPSSVYLVLSPDQVDQFENMYDETARRVGRQRASDSDIQMFGFYIANNAGIALRTFAAGIVFGLGSLFVLIFNGVFISTVCTHLINVGSSETILSFVAGHSALELVAIVLAGASGLMLGFPLIAPGAFSRAVALKLAAIRAARIIMGCVPMLVLAACIEAFWSSLSVIPPIVKYVVGLTMWLLVLAYFTLVGRRATS